MTSGILDTSTVILLGRITNADDLPDEPLITAVTLAELSVGPLVATTEEDRFARQAHLQSAESDFEPLPFDTDAARCFGRVAADLRSAGRKVAARAFDAMIAATAMSHNMPIYTCDPQDFQGIGGVIVVPVLHPDHPH